MNNWKVVKFEDIVENFDGKRIPIKSSKRENTIGSYPYYGASGVIDYVDDYIFDGNYLLISEDGANLLARTYPIAFQATGKFWVNNHAHIVKAKSEKTTNDFLEYYFSSIDISEWVTGSAQPKLNQKKLNSIKVPLPSLELQQQIVAKLDALFERINKSISLLEENIQYTKDLMASVLDDEFGRIESKGIKICDVIVKTKTIDPKKEYKNDSFTYVDISAINKEIHKITDVKEIIGNDAPSRARKVIEKGDIIFATTRPNLKNIAIVEIQFKNAVASTGFCVLKVNDERIDNEYLYFYLLSERVQDLIKPFIRGAQYPAISDKDLSSIEIPLPSIEYQKDMTKKIKMVFEKRELLIQEQTEKLNNLKSLKSSLLDKAFKGELVI